MDVAVVDDLADFLGALLECGHDLEDALQGVRDLAAGHFASMNQVESTGRST